MCTGVSWLSLPCITDSMTCLVRAWSSAVAKYRYWLAWALGWKDAEVDAVGAEEDVEGSVLSIFFVVKTSNMSYNSVG